MRTLDKLYFFGFLVLVSLTAACPNVNKPYPERTFYLFEVSSPTQVATVQGTSVDINRFTISPRSEGREFIYRTTDLEYKSDFYNQFFRPPHNIITEATRQWINESEVFADVLTPVSQAIADYQIEGNIIELYGDFRNEASAQAVLSMQLFLLKLSEDGSDPQILLSKTYSSTQPIGQASPQNLMNGWNIALDKILNEFLTDVSYHLRQSEQISQNQAAK